MNNDPVLGGSQCPFSAIIAKIKAIFRKIFKQG